MSSIISSFILFKLLILVLRSGLTNPDPVPLHDHCVADTETPQKVFLNGEPCINPALADSSHFVTSVLSNPGDVKANPFGFNVTLTNTKNLPGVNTQGLTLARADIASNGLVPPHWHPRASELTILIRGSLLVGFVDTSNRLFMQQLLPGDTFMFPKGLMHFLYNNINEKLPAVAASVLNSQNPGAQLAPLATFKTKPPIPYDVLKNSFKITEKEVDRIRKNLGG